MEAARSAAGRAVHGSTRRLTRAPGPVGRAGRAVPAGRAVAARGCGRPARRYPPLEPPGVLGLRDRHQVVLVQFDEAARRDRTARHPAPPAAHHGGHDAAQLQNVVLADEIVQLGPWPAGYGARVGGVRGMAEPVALVPVPGHPGPRVLGHLPGHQQGPLERVQHIEDRPGGARAVRGQQEHRDVRMQPGDPAGFVHTPLAQRVGHDHDRPGGIRSGHSVQPGQEFVLPRTRLGGHLAECVDQRGWRGSQVFAAQVAGSPVQQQYPLQRQRPGVLGGGQEIGGGAVRPGAVAGHVGVWLLPF